MAYGMMMRQIMRAAAAAVVAATSAVALTGAARDEVRLTGSEWAEAELPAAAGAGPNKTAASGAKASGTEASAADQDGKTFGVIEFPANYMRSRPDYESSLENQALMGTPVEILDSSGYWLKIRTPEPYVAWATNLGIVRMDSLALAEYIAAPKYICTAVWTDVLASPSKNADRICGLVAGDLLRISCGDNGKPLKSRGFVGVMLPSGKKGFVSGSSVSEFSVWADTVQAAPDNIISTAMSFNGTPYMWGGASSYGLDCSGLVRLVYFLNGILLHRNASQQAEEGEGIDIDDLRASIIMADRSAADASASVGSGDGCLKGLDALRKGDLLFFGKIGEDGRKRISHVGIYVGGGRFIHASQMVRVSSLDSSQPDYYEGSARLVAARRIVDGCGRPYSCGRVRDSRYYFLLETAARNH